MTGPIHILSLGAGVQSSTLALMAAIGEILPMPSAAIFADTRVETQNVYRWLDWLETKLPFPVLRVSRGNLSEVSLEIRKKKKGPGFWSKSLIPAFIKNPDGSRGIMGRACTTDFKIAEIIRKTRELVGKETMAQWRRTHRAALALWSDYRKEKVSAQKQKRPARIPFPHAAWKSMQDDALVVQWIGISLDEISRVKPSREPWIRHRWPLGFEVGMRRNGCELWLERRGYGKAPRSACRQCPFHSDVEWLRMRNEEPDEFALAVQFDYDLRRVKAKTDNLGGIPFLHSSLVPLDRIDFSNSAHRGQGDLFGNECTGLCGV